MYKYVLFAATLLFAACSTVGKDNSDGLPMSLPKELELTIDIDDYIIVDSKVISPSGLSIRFGQRYANGHKIVMSFYPEPPNGRQRWLADIPPIKSGTANIVAKLHSGKNKLPRGLVPPDEVILNITIQNKHVSYHHIDNASDETLGLYYDKSVVRGNIRFGVIRSKMFPRERWIFRFPTSDNKFILSVRRQD